MDNKSIKGKIHSIESFSTIDGPGIRSVLFMSGCFLKCPFCHNIDVVLNPANQVSEPAEILQYLKKFSDYWGDDGGITLSGGDPLVQIEFTQEITKLAIGEGINVTIDTALISDESSFRYLMDALYTPGGISDSTLRGLESDIPANRGKIFWMSSFKPHIFAKDTPGYNLDNFLANLRALIDRIRLSERVSLRIRYVVIKGFTDNLEACNELVELLSQIDVPFELELLPYVSWGEKKWADQGLEYLLKGLSSTNHEELMQFRNMVEQQVKDRNLSNVTKIMPLIQNK
ncbi:MAG TPA: radical SAM protein [Candidatus Dojkabacteria bacterium]|mgnify:CR=1 FL=1|nr:radical SAM protein [Candidatus Dojkabacteria bacterium]HQG57463.1 radical SAM protein [Candidatus Dojkabacteria bacterium]